MKESSWFLLASIVLGSLGYVPGAVAAMFVSFVSVITEHKKDDL